jgi:hypothetical protein
MKFKIRLICSLIAFSFIGFYGCGSSKINTDSTKHLQVIATSRLNNDIVISLDTVYFKGEAHSILKTTGISLSPFYHFSSLKGEKAIDVLPYSAEGNATTHNEYIFFGNSQGMKAYKPYSFSTISICEEVVNNNLLSTTSLRAIDVGNFVKNNPRPAKFNAASLKVRREMTKEIKLNEGYGEIYQADKLIGKFTRSYERNNNMLTIKNIYQIKFLNGTLCGTVSTSADKSDRKQNKYMEAITEYDGQVHRLTIDDANTDWDFDSFKQALKYLVANGYL